jgi:hypothetical protein
MQGPFGSAKLNQSRSGVLQGSLVPTALDETSGCLLGFAGINWMNLTTAVTYVKAVHTAGRVIIRGETTRRTCEMVYVWTTA